MEHIITTPMSVLRRQTLTRKLAYRKAEVLSWEYDVRHNIVKILTLISIFAAIALPFYPAITT